MFDSAKALPTRTIMRPISVLTISLRFRVMHGLLLNATTHFVIALLVAALRDDSLGL